MGAFITAGPGRRPGDASCRGGPRAGKMCRALMAGIAAPRGDPENAYTARGAFLTGRELRALGVNFDHAPSVDVNSNPENPVIGARSYGDTPQESLPVTPTG